MKRKFVAMLCLASVLAAVLTVGIIPASATNDDWIDREPVSDADYSFAVMGDIQFVTYSDHLLGTNYLETMVTWLLDNQEKRNIQYLFELGDTVQTFLSAPASQNPMVNNPGEWETAAAQFSRLDGKLGYSVVRGNHDDEGGYHAYICSRAYRKQMDGFFCQANKETTRGNSMSNSYRKIQIGNHKYLMLSLDYIVTPEALSWADDLIHRNYDHKVIVSMHAYLAKDGSFYRGEVSSSNVDGTATETLPFDGEYLWNHLFSKHDNLFMILSGHLDVEDPVIRTRTGIHGNEVIEMLVDPQGYEAKDTCGFLMMLNFTEGGRKIEVEYFSPSRGKYFREKNQLSLSLPEGTLPAYVPSESFAQSEAVSEAVSETVRESEEAEGEATPPNGFTIVLSAVLGGAVILCGIFLIAWKIKRK